MTASLSARPQRLVCCTECGTVQRAAELAPPLNQLDCERCDHMIERSNGRSLAASLACASAALALLIPANLMTFMSTSIAGVSRRSVVGSSVKAMWVEGYPELAIVLALLVIVLPILRMGLLTAVLGTLRLGRRPRWLGRAFRWADTLQVWAMADVFLLAFVIAYLRLEATISVTMGLGAYCYVAAALLTLLTRATLDPRAVWEAIAADRAPPVGTPVLNCPGCDQLLPLSMEGRACPRCAARLRARKPESVGRAAALTAAAAILYIPANLYSMATLPLGLQSVQYTVLEGVLDLSEAKLYALAAIVFLASFAIPLLKLAVLAWCIASVMIRSSRHLVLKTRAYGVIEEIGRWSMVDPFVIACFVPVTQYNALIHGRAGPAAPVFAAVVILTTLAALAFDPRRLWDAGSPRTILR